MGAWHWLSGTVESVWQLGVLLYKLDKEMREISWLFLTHQWAELDKKLTGYRSKGREVLAEASEAKELLNLIFHDQPTRDLIAAFAKQWWAAIPPDEQDELAVSGGTQIIVEVAIGVLLATFTAGVGGAAYGSAKWAAAGGRLGARLEKLLDEVKDACECLAKALKKRKRKVVDVGRWVDAAKVIETKWKPVSTEMARLLPLKLKAMDAYWVGEHLRGGTWWMETGHVVKYLNATERAQYKLTIRDGLVYDAKGKLFDTRAMQTMHSLHPGSAIFVMDESGSLYAGSAQMDRFHHSSFFAGGPVAAAGEIEVTDGVMMSISDRSGHYRASAFYLAQALEVLEAQGIPSSGLSITAFGTWLGL